MSVSIAKSQIAESSSPVAGTHILERDDYWRPQFLGSLRSLDVIRWLSILLILIPVTALSQGLQTPLQPTDLQSTLKAAIERVRAASILITSDERGGGSCSGVIVDEKGTILTAGHCVSPGTHYTVELPDGRSFEAEGLGRENKVDIGMMKILDADENLPFVKLGRSSLLAKGQGLFGLSHPGIPVPRRGYVLRFGRVVKPLTKRGFIHSTVLMEPGDSGGPLFNLQGELVGIHSQIDRPEESNFDAPIDLFHDHWDHLLAGKSFRLSKIAAASIDLKVEDLDDGEGAVVESLGAEGLAKSQGLQKGDLIQQLNKRDIQSARHFRKRLRRILAKRGPIQLKLIVERAGTKKEISICSKPSPKSETATESAPLAILDAENPLAKIAEALKSPGVVQISSKQDGERREIMGIVVSRFGHIVSKSSEVFDDAALCGEEGENEAGEPQELKVIARDEKSDLCLLVPTSPLDLTPLIWAESGHQIGDFVFSPLAESKAPKVGVAASRAYRPKVHLVFGFELADRDGELVIKRIFEGKPAAETDLKEDDVIVSMDGTSVKDLTGFRAVMEKVLSSRDVTFVVRREQKVVEIKIAPKPNTQSAKGPSMHIATDVPGGLSKRREGFPEIFVHDTKIRPEECGGALFNRQGQAVGLNIARLSRAQALALTPAVVQLFLSKHLK